MQAKDECVNGAKETPPSDMDGGWKQIIDDLFEEFLRFYFPHVHEKIDFSRGYEYLDKELARLAIASTTGDRAVDKLVRVHWKSGHGGWVLIHVEIQAQPDHDFAERMCRYNIRIWDRYGKDVVSLAILADRNRSFRPTWYHRELGQCRHEFHFPVVKLLDHRTESQLETDPSPMAVVSLLQLRRIRAGRDPRQLFACKVDETRKLLARRGLTDDDIQKLFRFLDYLFRLPEELELHYRAAVHTIEEEMNMPYMTSIERLARQEGLEEGMRRGIEQGIEQGMEKGMEKGLEKGVIEGLRTSVCKALEVRFGKIPDSLREQISRTSDQGALDALLQRVLTVDSLADLNG